MSCVAVGEKLKLHKFVRWRAPLWGWVEEARWQHIDSIQRGGELRLEWMVENEVIFFQHSGEALIKVVTLEPTGKDWRTLYTKRGTPLLRTYGKLERTVVITYFEMLAAIWNAGAALKQWFVKRFGYKEGEE